MTREQEEYLAIITKVLTEGNVQSYAVAVSEEVNTSITFSLEAEVWQEDNFPISGEIVILSKLIKMKKGWRAMSARRFKPCDEKTAKRNKDV